MPKHTLNRLTRDDCKKLTCPPEKKRERVRDGGELYLEALPSGKKFWRMRVFTPSGKENRLKFGTFPEVSLDEARQRRDDVRRAMRDGRDPVEERRQARTAVAELTFAAAYQEWFEYRTRDRRWSDSHTRKVQHLATAFLLPKLGKRAIKKIEPPELLAAVEAINSQKERRVTARVTLGVARQIIDFAISKHGSKDFEHNIALPLLRSRLLPTPVTEHYKAVTTTEDLARIIKAIRSYHGRTPSVPTALQLVPLLFLRQYNVRTMLWERIDWQAATVKIPRREMKTKRGSDWFVCPLPTQAIALLKALNPKEEGFVFPNTHHHTNAPIGPSSMDHARRVLGIHKEQTMHGFRATAKTILLEKGFSRDAIEVQLDHSSRDATGRAYDRAEYLEERRSMLQFWADLIDELANS